MKSVRICVAAITAGVVCIAVMLGILSAAIYAENESGDSFIGLMYHQVLKDESRAGKYIITPGELESDLAYLSENGYVSVLPSQLVKIREQGGRLPEKTVVISFDVVYETGLYYVLPLLKKYRQINYVEVEQHAIRQSFVRIGQTLKHLPQDKQVFWFLLAFFCYIDGVYTIIDMATAYGTALGLDTTGLLLALLVTQIVAFPSALIFGRLSQKYESKTLIPVCIAAYTGIAVFAFFLKSQWQFWVLAVVVGMFQGGVQALSRSHFAKIIPQEKSGEYFGLFDICGKGASFLGTMIVSVGSQLTGSANVGVGSIAILFVIGFVLFGISTRTEETKQV